MAATTSTHMSGTMVECNDAERLASLVRDVFAHYPNHYAANPLLSDELSLDGYVEWALRTSERTGYLVLRDDDDVGFAVIDWSVEVPDVRLAGVVPAHQGAGRYRDVVAGMMERAVDAGRSGLEISTQVGNIAPQRTWAGLGWRPTRAYDTTHLVRAELLEPSWRPSR